MIPLAIPNLTGNERKYTADAIASGHVGTDGPYVERFEEMVAKATGRDWCVATSSGTAAIHLALETLRVPTVVSLPSYTFGATINAVHLAGATPYFLDIDESWTAPKAVLSVETFGNPTRGNGIIDAAASIGRGRLGGRIACLSFNANKTITTGGGGAIVGDGPSIVAKARLLSRQGKIGQYDHACRGFNYRMPNINAAMGCAQMERLEEFVDRKRAIAKRYREAFGQGFLGIEVSSCWMSGVIVKNAEHIALLLRHREVEARRMWTPLHLQPPWRDVDKGKLHVTDGLWKSILALPCSTGLTKGQQNKVIKACREFVKSSP